MENTNKQPDKDPMDNDSYSSYLGNWHVESSPLDVAFQNKNKSKPSGPTKLIARKRSFRKKEPVTKTPQSTPSFHKTIRKDQKKNKETSRKEPSIILPSTNDHSQLPEKKLKLESNFDTNNFPQTSPVIYPTLTHARATHLSNFSPAPHTTREITRQEYSSDNMVSEIMPPKVSSKESTTSCDVFSSADYTKYSNPKSESMFPPSPSP